MGIDAVPSVRNTAETCVNRNGTGGSSIVDGKTINVWEANRYQTDGYPHLKPPCRCADAQLIPSWSSSPAQQLHRAERSSALSVG
jgi:hypothetical protein